MIQISIKAKNSDELRVKLADLARFLPTADTVSHTQMELNFPKIAEKNSENEEVAAPKKRGRRSNAEIAAAKAAEAAEADDDAPESTEIYGRSPQMEGLTSLKEMNAKQEAAAYTDKDVLAVAKTLVSSRKDTNEGLNLLKKVLTKFGYASVGKVLPGDYTLVIEALREAMASE